MEKFKQLRLKFEQRRSMRSQAARAQSQAQETDKLNANATTVVESSKESGNIERVKGSNAVENDQKVKPVQSGISESDTTGVKEQKGNAVDTSKERVKAVAMPVKRSSAASSDKSQPEMKFKASKDKAVSMPVKKKPADTNEQAPTGVTFKINKDKAVSMPVKRRDTTEEQVKSEVKFKTSKDKVVSMPVKRRDTEERDKGDTNKRLSGTDPRLSGSGDKETPIKPVGAKCVSMPIKQKKSPEKDATSGVKIKTSGHVSMPVKRKDTKEKEIAQTNEKGKTKETVKDKKSEQKAGIAPLKAENKVEENIKLKDIKSDKPATKISETKDAKDNKDRKVQFLSVNEVDDATKNAKKPEALKPALKKSSVEERGEKKLDTLAVEEFTDINRERKSSLSEDKLQEIQEAFVVFDQNRDGVITKEELGAVLYALGQRPTVEEVQALIRSVDLDKSGTIDFDEFVKIFSSKLTVDPEQELHEVFDIFDSNLDGFISDDELFAVLQKLGEQTSLAECKKMIAEADLNGDGKVDYREFKAILNSR